MKSRELIFSLHFVSIPKQSALPVTPALAGKRWRRPGPGSSSNFPRPR